MNGCHKLNTGSARNGAKVIQPAVRDTDNTPVARVAEAANMEVAAIARAISPEAIMATGATIKPHTVMAHITPYWIAAVCVSK